MFRRSVLAAATVLVASLSQAQAPTPKNYRAAPSSGAPSRRSSGASPQSTTTSCIRRWSATRKAGLTRSSTGQVCPTGRTRRGLNYWTFSPMVGFTYLVPEQGLDFSAKFGVDINAENPDTDYYSGAVAHLDLSVTKNLTPNLRSAHSPVSSIRSTTTVALSPTRMTASRASRSPSARWSRYKAKFGETEIDFRLKWAHEVEVENRIKATRSSLTSPESFRRAREAAKLKADFAVVWQS